MARLLAVVSAITFFIMAGTVSAVGLGDITLRSALTEPLDAQIRITSPGDLQPEDLTARLASAAEFSRAGIERPFFLTELRFTVVQRNGQFWVDVSSARPVEEPFLDFLVELAWPGGRLLREYTLLLDPPVFAPSDAAPQVFPGQTPSFSQQPVAPVVEPTPPVAPVVAPSTAPRVEALSDNQYRVQNNDTLWEIALRNRTDASQSPQQIMLAIQDLNPDAFINNNINRVKAGSLLTLPNGEQVLIRSRNQAVEEVERQNRAFRGLPPQGQQQVTASGDAASATAASTPRNPDGFLEIVGTASDASSGSAAGASERAETARLQNELAIQQELNDELRRQNEQQLSRLNELEEQVRLLTQMMELQSAAAAELQAAARDLQQQAQASQPATPQQAAPVLEPVPAVSLMDQVNAFINRAMAWVMQPMNALLVGLGAVLVLGLVLIARRRKAQAEDEVEELLDDADDVLLHDDPFEDLADDNNDEDYTEDELSSEDDAVAKPQESSPSATEALENAELYMAFQRHDEAESVLKQALNDEPAHRDIRLKLLELYAETGRVNEFDAMAADLLPADHDEVSRLRSAMQTVGAGMAEADLGARIETPAEEDFADLDLDLDLSDDDSWSGDDLSSTEDNALDFDLANDGGSTDLSEEDSDDELSSALFEESDDELPALELPDIAGDDEVDELDLSDLDVPELDDETDIPLIDERSESSLSDADDLDPEVEAALASTEADAHLDTELDELGDLSDLDLDSLSLDDAEEEVLDITNLLEDDDSAVDEPLQGSSLEDDFSKSLSDTLDELSSEPSRVDSSSATGAAEEADAELNDDGFADLGELDDLDDLMDTERFIESSGEAALTDGGLDDFDLQDDELSFSANDEDGVEEEVRSASSLDDLTELEDSVANSADMGSSDDWDDDFDFLAGSDEVATKLDLARAYIDMDDVDGAKDILNEVVEEGNDEQKAAAETLLRKL